MPKRESTHTHTHQIVAHDVCAFNLNSFAVAFSFVAFDEMLTRHIHARQKHEMRFGKLWTCLSVSCAIARIICTLTTDYWLLKRMHLFSIPNLCRHSHRDLDNCTCSWVDRGLRLAIATNCHNNKCDFTRIDIVCATINHLTCFSCAQPESASAYLAAMLRTQLVHQFRFGWCVCSVCVWCAFHVFIESRQHVEYERNSHANALNDNKICPRFHPISSAFVNKWCFFHLLPLLRHSIQFFVNDAQFEGYVSRVAAIGGL